LFSAALRGEQITVIMANNTNYGTTGGQMAPTTLMGQITTTTPHGRDPWFGYPAHVPEMLCSMKGVAYTARGALVTPGHWQRTKKYIRTAIEKQMAGLGLTFVEVLTACPPNWHLTPLDCIKRIEEEVMSEFPVGEFTGV
jgi:2-oxoglutarate ferredoxin oxidoreductase subunit beta